MLTPSIPGLVAHTELVDGVDAVRLAARTQLRRGATQVKLFASGGVMSPTDPLDSLQFSVEEIAAAVHEAKAFGKYAMAHCHTSAAMNNALDAGVRSIEHGSILDEQTARKMADQDAYLVPTLVIIELLTRMAELPDVSRVKAEMVHGKTAASVVMAQAAGVHIGSGSDLLGPRQRHRGGELVEKAKHLGAMGAIVSATKTNAALFRLEDRIGTIAEGKDADLILVDRRSAGGYCGAGGCAEYSARGEGGGGGEGWGVGWVTVACATHDRRDCPQGGHVGPPLRQATVARVALTVGRLLRGARASSLR